MDWLPLPIDWRDVSLAWPWLLLALPLPALVSWWARPVPSHDPALRVPGSFMLMRATPSCSE